MRTSATYYSDSIRDRRMEMEAERLSRRASVQQRRKLANRIARGVRLQEPEIVGPFEDLGFRLREAPRGDCEACGFRGRLFAFAWWVPMSPTAPRLGSVHRSRAVCVVCMEGEVKRVGVRL